jgi:membrane-associated phospholipid phosphatase
VAACGAQALRRNHVAQWGSFVLQVLIAVSFELADDIGRGLFSQHGTLQGIRNARQIVAFEAGHGFWVEPAWQDFFLRTRHLFALTISWLDVAHIMNGIYVAGHVLLTLSVAIWVYFYRRRYFVMLRNVIMLCNAFALVVYESFPVAPPRLTTGLTFDGHPFTFQDTVFGLISNGGRLMPSKLTYNEFSAMPSVHIAWALVAGATLLILARPLLLRGFGVLYPVLMLVAVVVTGNHYLLDAVGGLGIVVLAGATSFLLARLATQRGWPIWVRQYVVGEG